METEIKKERHTLQVIYVADRFERKVIRSFFREEIRIQFGKVRLGSVWSGLDWIGVLNRDFI